MDYAATIDFLFNLEHGSVKLGLGRIAAAAAALDHPERSYQTIHVAGTNGKGSTSAFLASIFSAAGYRSGLLTSPHLLAYGERFRIDGRMVSEAKIIELTAELKPIILEMKLSYFEATTMIAFEAFARAGVEVAVFEVGMGGRLDATNIIRPALSVITGIDFDHTKALGATLELIAAEKAGIIKPATPLIAGQCTDGVCEVFRKRCSLLGATFHSVTDLASAKRITPSGVGTGYEIERCNDQSSQNRTIRLSGDHQVSNAVVAEEGARLMAATAPSMDPKRPVDSAACSRGLAQVGWPGRFHTFPATPDRPEIIFDVAHNAAGGETVAATYQRWRGARPDPTLIVGMLGDKDHETFLASLRAVSASVILIPLESPRFGGMEQLSAAAADAGFRPVVAEGIGDAWDRARKMANPVLITGSFKTVEAAMNHLAIGPQQDLFASGAGDIGTS
jgi:dihydrofolate synthase / folylpolyglutamate synthase